MKKLLLLFLVLPFIGISQSVKGNFSPADDFTYAFLYKSTLSGADYVERGQLDANGSFEIALDSTMSPGIYKIIYAIPPEENNFDFIYDGKESVVFDFSYDNGVVFTASEENKLWNSYLKSMDMVNQTISNFYTKESTDEKGFKAIFKTLKDTQSGYENLANGKLVSAFIVANRPYIPTEYEDISTYSKNLKSNYLANIDFSDNLLQSSTFLVDRVTSYVFNMVQNPSDEIYKHHVDDVVNAINTNNTAIKTSLLEIIWQRFVALENHDLANYITETYLLDLAISAENKVLAETLIAYKNTSIGTKAPNFDILLDGNKTSLHQLNSTENYLLIFWSSGCSHCLTELPLVKDMVADKPNLKVVAFGLEENEKEWSKAIKNFPDFIHTIGLDKWDNPIVKTYGIAATPTYIVLNKDKTIVAKPYDFEDLKVVLEGL